MPLGIARLGAWINNHGHTADLYDINIDKESLEDTIKNGNYDIIGFSPLHCSLEYDLGAIHLAKKLSPESLLVAGGIEATLNYQQILDYTPCDIVVLAEGEEPLLDLCNKKSIEEIDGIIYRKHAKPITKERLWEINKCMDYGAMRHNEYWAQTKNLYDEPDETEIKTARIFTMSHCPMNCNFCSVRRYHESACGAKVKTVMLDPEQMVYCVGQLMEEYEDLKTVFFVEDEFCINKKRVFEFCRLVKGWGLTYICLARIDSMTEPLIRVMAEAGFRVISFGTESLSQKVCDGLNKKQDCSLIEPAVDMCIKYGIKPYMTLMMFTPDTQIEDLLMDYRGLKKFFNKDVGLSIEPYIMPLHGSDLYEQTDNQFQNMIFDIPETNKKIKKPVAAYPKDEKVREIMMEFEKVFYGRREEAAKKVKHREKQFQARVILDVVGEILKERGYL